MCINVYFIEPYCSLMIVEHIHTISFLSLCMNIFVLKWFAINVSLLFCNAWFGRYGGAGKQLITFFDMDFVLDFALWCLLYLIVLA